MRHYSINIIASRGRFFAAGEDVPDDVSVAPAAERYRIHEDEQPDERISSTSVEVDVETTERSTRERAKNS